MIIIDTQIMRINDYDKAGPLNANHDHLGLSGQMTIIHRPELKAIDLDNSAYIPGLPRFRRTVRS